MTTTREAKRLKTQQSLLSAARDLFEKQGFTATTIDEIATRAGTTRATLYLHFTSKAAVLERLVATLDEMLSAVGEPALTDVIRAGEPQSIRAWLARKLEQWADVRPYLAMITQSDTDPTISAVVCEWHDRVIIRMQNGLDEAGRFDRASRQIRCTIAFGALESLSRRYISLGGWSDADRDIALESLTRTWTHLLAATSSSSEMQETTNDCNGVSLDVT